MFYRKPMMKGGNMKGRSRMVLAAAACACFIAMCSFSGCTAKKEDKGVEKVEQSAAQKANLARQQKKQAKAQERKEHKRYEDLAMNKIQTFKAKITKMKTGAARASGQNKARMTRELRELDKRLRDVEFSCRKMMSADPANWQKERAKFDRSARSFEQYYSRVSSADK
jgi:hypothetical protein